jgi:predicted GNAT superfamily acetyltransferase
MDAPGGGRTPQASRPVIRDLVGRPDTDACVALQRLVWGADFREVVPQTLLDLARRLGGIAAGAFDGDTLIGFVFGITGLCDGRIAHWSDMLAVHPDARDRGIGGALKRYQRQTLLERGVETVYWTFEPLEARNAFLNFARLGGIATRYVRDFYESSDSPLHDTIGTDRFIVRWDLASARVDARLSGAEMPPAAEDIADLPRVNAVGDGSVPAPPRLDLDDPRIRVAIPSPIQTIKRERAHVAMAWRRTTREAFEAYLGRGYEVVEAVRVAENEVDYVLARETA